MFANYHTHTWRCHHASGTEKEYVETAVKGGLKILGFSDHTPYPFPKGVDTHAKMGMDELEGYVDTVLGLRDEYKDDIEIHLGLEVEYLPPYFDELVRFAEQFPIEYFIMGQHYLNVEPDIHFVGSPFGDGMEEAHLKKYVDLCIEGLKTGKFTYLAHPDLFNFKGLPLGMAKTVQGMKPEEVGQGDVVRTVSGADQAQNWEDDLTAKERFYVSEMRRLCRYLHEADIPAEINFLGIWDHRHYPNPLFWKIAGEEHVKAIFGCDAHQPEKVWNPEAEKRALEIVEENKLELVEELKF